MHLRLHLMEELPNTWTATALVSAIERTAPTIRDNDRNGPPTKFLSRERAAPSKGNHNSSLAGLKMERETALYSALVNTTECTDWACKCDGASGCAADNKFKFATYAWSESTHAKK